MAFHASRRSSYLYPLICLIFGLILFFMPGLLIGVLSTVLGAVCIVWGVGRIVRAMNEPVRDLRVSGLLFGVLAALFGIYIMRHSGSVLRLLPLAAGLFFLFDGIERIRSAVAWNKSDSSLLSRMGAAGIFGVILILAGLWLILFPLGAVKATLRIIGVLILIDGAGDLYNAYRREEKKKMGFSPDGKYETEYRDVTNDDKK